MPTRCHCERASSRLTAPADRSPAISTRVTWFLSSSGRSKVASARVSPSPSVKAVSPSRWPRADTACRTPAREPPWARSTCASRRPSAATPAEVASASSPGRVSTIEKPPPASSCSRSAKRAGLAVVVDAVGEPDHASRSCPRSAAASASTAAMRSGANGCGCSAVAVERASVGASIFRLMPRVALAVGTIITGRLCPSASAISRSIRKVRADHCAAADQPLSTTSTTGPEPPSALSRFGIEHRLGQRQDDQRGRQHADQRQPPGRLRRRLLAVLDADQDAGRREREAPRLRRHGAQQPPDDRQRQDAGQQPGTEEGDRPERHGAPSAVRPSDFQR